MDYDLVVKYYLGNVNIAPDILSRGPTIKKLTQQNELLMEIQRMELSNFRKSDNTTY